MLMYCYEFIYIFGILTLNFLDCGYFGDLLTDLKMSHESSLGTTEVRATKIFVQPEKVSQKWGPGFPAVPSKKGG